MKTSIAIVVVAYNREKSLKRLLDSLMRSYIEEETTLIISIDHSNNPKVAQIANEFQWSYGKKEVVCHKVNLGLRKHILGTGKYLNDYDAIIVLEDDLIVSKNFYMFAKQAVEKYYTNDAVAGISLYSFGVNYQTFYPFIPQPSAYDAFFMKCAQSWGQVWMKKQWCQFEQWYNEHKDDSFDRNVLPQAICSWSSKSWLKYHIRYCIESKKYFVYPYISLTSNCGETGTHLKFSSPVFQRPVAEYDNTYKYYLPELNKTAVRYDGFFESERLYESLKLHEDELYINLANTKCLIHNKRFILTTKLLGYKLVKSFGLSYTPIELNVINNNPGNLIFLYDTNEKGVKPKPHPPIIKRILFAYENNVDIFAVIRRLQQYGLINLLRTLFNAL